MSGITSPSFDIDLGGGLTVDLEGNPATPVSALITGDPNKPLSTQITGDVNKPLSTLIIGDPNKPISMQIQGNPAKPVAVSMEMMNLPRFTLTDIKDLMKVRIRLPHYEQFCFKLFGIEVFSFCMSGEAQLITEPYVPNAHERCEIVDCCEPDTRPFPKQQG